jgi:polar amino acid transport system substrate-binding protein
VTRTRRRRPTLPVASALLLSTVTLLSACSSSAEIEAAQVAPSNAGAAAPLVVDTSPEQSARVATTEAADAAALVPDAIAADGRLTVGIVGAGDPPLAFLADDNSTVVGSEVDIASLVAASLGLELDVRNISWEQWPLSVQSGDVEAVFSNVGVNAARLELFDFATYRQGIMAFTAEPDSTLSISEAEDVAGLTLAVGSGTRSGSCWTGTPPTRPPAWSRPRWTTTPTPPTHCWPSPPAGSTPTSGPTPTRSTRRARARCPSSAR